ncbi:MAG: hypothetical protein JJ971_05890 [Balneolaceae bacterium]|nr:hypothetical protein [Balneolaceae bacterium]MBO6545909.1 hypothetical protein [Balneolaceae bacterium]MBO6647305.1 hypothetical protein [Balneolaceae bacterium]
MKKNRPFYLLFLLALIANPAIAQYGEPEIQSIEAPKNLYDEGYKAGFGFSFNLNDFGFGVGSQFRLGLGPYTEGLINFKIAGLRDPSEQTYIDYYFGSRTIPSKYKRVVTFPLTVGLKRRVFARQISDNFRVHTSMSFGPTMALTTPYFKDLNNNGFREANITQFSIYEPVQDIFSGLKDAETKWGWTGDLVLGIDFGDNFARLQTFQFGYSFYYFEDGLQILEPFKPFRNTNGNYIDNNNDGIADVFESANDKINYFGSAQITFIFGWMW